MTVVTGFIKCNQILLNSVCNFVDTSVTKCFFMTIMIHIVWTIMFRLPCGTFPALHFELYYKQIWYKHWKIMYLWTWESSKPELTDPKRLETHDLQWWQATLSACHSIYCSGVWKYKSKTKCWRQWCQIIKLPHSWNGTLKNKTNSSEEKKRLQKSSGSLIRRARRQVLLY